MSSFPGIAPFVLFCPGVLLSLQSPLFSSHSTSYANPRTSTSVLLSTLRSPVRLAKSLTNFIDSGFGIRSVRNGRYRVSILERAASSRISDITLGVDRRVVACDRRVDSGGVFVRRGVESRRMVLIAFWGCGGADLGEDSKTMLPAGGVAISAITLVNTSFCSGHFELIWCGQEIFLDSPCAAGNKVREIGGNIRGCTTS